MSEDPMDCEDIQKAQGLLADEEEEMAAADWQGGMALANYGYEVISALLPELLDAGNEEDQLYCRSVVDEVDQAWDALVDYIDETKAAGTAMDLERIVAFTDNLLYSLQYAVGSLVIQWSMLCPDQPLPTPPIVQRPFQLIAEPDDDD